MKSRLVSLCQPLQMIKNEHEPLRRQLEQIYHISTLIGNDDMTSNWKSYIEALRGMVIKFVKELEIHSSREDKILIPLLANHLESTTGTIATMEFEHEQASNYFKRFLQETELLHDEYHRDEAIRLAALAIQAYLILTYHFHKEEDTIFPMAERILSDYEKGELEEKLLL